MLRFANVHCVFVCVHACLFASVRGYVEKKRDSNTKLKKFLTSTLDICYILMGFEPLMFNVHVILHNNNNNTEENGFNML